MTYSDRALGLFSLKSSTRKWHALPSFFFNTEWEAQSGRALEQDKFKYKIQRFARLFMANYVIFFHMKILKNLEAKSNKIITSSGFNQRKSSILIAKKRTSKKYNTSEKI